MSEAEERTRETPEIAPGSGRPDGQSVLPGAHGLTVVTTELGDTNVDPSIAWEALAEEGPMVLRCAECGMPLRVGLEVPLDPRGREALGLEE